MKNLLFLLFTTFTMSLTFGQSPKNIIKKLGTDPIFFIDSINVDSSEMQKYDPQQISLVTVYKDKNAIDLMGEDGKDGVIYIETKKFSEKRFKNYFKSKSNEYSKLLASEKNESNFIYILNGKLLSENYEGDLASINDKVFVSLKIISKDDLEKFYKVSDKSYGILINSDVPDNLYKGKEKFK